jgi:ABC-type lipopolysaccharide export system ATPase subunit
LRVRATRVLETGKTFIEGIAGELLCNPKVKEAYLGGLEYLMRNVLMQTD